MPSKFKEIFSVVLPCFLSLGLLAWLFITIDYKHIWLAVKGSDMRYMSAAGIIFFFINFLIIWRWRILMKAVGLKAKTLSSLRWYFIGSFCNLAPISTVGSDVIRGLGIAQELGSKPKVFASIVLDRLSGFAGLVSAPVVAEVYQPGFASVGLLLAILGHSLGAYIGIFTGQICRLFN